MHVLETFLVYPFEELYDSHDEYMHMILMACKVCISDPVSIHGGSDGTLFQRPLNVVCFCNKLQNH